MEKRGSWDWAEQQLGEPNWPMWYLQSVWEIQCVPRCYDSLLVCLSSLDVRDWQTNILELTYLRMLCKTTLVIQLHELFKSYSARKYPGSRPEWHSLSGYIIVMLLGIYQIALIHLELALKACPGFLDVFFVLQSHAPCSQPSWVLERDRVGQRVQLLNVPGSSFWSSVDISIFVKLIKCASALAPPQTSWVRISRVFRVLAGICEDDFSVVLI